MIVGNLAAIAIPQYIKYVKRSRTSESPAHVKNLYDSLVDWYANPNLGNGTFAASTAALSKTGSLTYSGYFPQEADWWDNGDINYSYTITSYIGMGGGLIPRIRGQVRNPDAVFGEVVISSEHGEGTVSTVSATY